MLSGSGKLTEITFGVLADVDENWMGGVNYIANLLKTLTYLPGEERPRLVLVISSKAAAAFEKISAGIPNVEARYMAEPPVICKLLPSKIRSYAEGLHKLFQVRSIIAKNSIDVLFPISGFHFTYLPTRCIGWIPDFQHKYLPQMFTEGEISKREKNFSRMAGHVPYMIFSSRNAMQDYEKYYPNFRSKNFVYSFCTVLIENLQIKGIEYLREKYKLGAKFIYLPNQFWVHKNHMLVFRAMADLADRGYNIELVCTGSNFEYRNSQYYGKLLRYKEEKNLDNIKLLGLVPVEDQYALYHHARAILQPSLFEGWSSIVEDARAFDKKIILSDIPVHREQNHHRAVYFNPHDERDLAQKIITVWEDTGENPRDFASIVKAHQSRVTETAGSLVEIIREVTRQ